MPTPSIDQIVRKGADTISRLVEIGADPLGLSGSSAVGEPIIAIRPPAAEVAGRLAGKLLWKQEQRGNPVVEAGYVAYLDGCFITWTVVYVRATLH